MGPGRYILDSEDCWDRVGRRDSESDVAIDDGWMEDE
jgi:hypothetical protein